MQSSTAPAGAAAAAPAKTEPSPRPARRAPATTPERATPDTRAPDDGRARAARRAVLAALTPLIGQRSLGDATPTDLGLLRAAFADVKGAPADADTIAALRRQSRLVRGAPRPGDLLFFHGAGGAAELAIVRSVGGDGVIDAVAVTRGAVRSIVVDRNNPHARRRGGRVVNTFLRARRQDDEPRAAYLAAQLLVDVRSIID
ncbi:MAG: hypothetical protein H6703_09230 [Myxococcales bacterium]|nr:hypothetical protein [Myxococcales bacterium]